MKIKRDKIRERIKKKIRVRRRKNRGSLERKKKSFVHSRERR